MKSFMQPSLIGVLACALLAGQLFADERVYPTDADFLNDKAPPYNAKGDDVTDDREAIQR